ncbi:DUF5662 family protein [Paenibacillus alginolyticus]|uniref:DUF5662 family protein n=1 Tax=Paenibacillus alginolyticus TaxID=59839 RepID=A0ABT4GMA9_9BACL|nr:DUF5662 family protein [Paenibacillus alginolyticus]MCY9697340.1 DUF5662 family protein [Paenibacillus alginolyticus]MEC0148210.1 DUF5662 family protein [Paenibacillus alginolyticus]
MMKAYWRYFLYIMNHKLNVLIECWKEGLYFQGVIHDFSKFSPAEFFPYAKKFYSGKPLVLDEELNWKYAWLRHKRKNKHHWEYWVINPNTNEALPMPKKYVIEMVCDWRSFSRKWGKKVKESTLNLTDSIVVHPETKRELELMTSPQRTDKPFN